MLNSLYGRTGLNPELSKSKVFTFKEISSPKFDDFLLNNEILSQIDLSNDDVSILSYKSLLDNSSSFLSSNVALASAITAYSRIHINKFKYLEGNVVYYSDTDSIVLNRPLDSSLISNNLGDMKLEFKHVHLGIFLAPKVYALDVSTFPKKVEVSEKYPDGIIPSERVQIMKFKGVVERFLPSFNEFIDLYSSLSKTFHQSKFIRSLSDGTVFIKDTKYSFALSNSKRINLFVNNKFVGSTPLFYINNTLIHTYPRCLLSFYPLLNTPKFAGLLNSPSETIDTPNNDDFDIKMEASTSYSFDNNFISLGIGESFAKVPTREDNKLLDELTEDYSNYRLHWEILEGYYVNILTDIRDLSLNVLPRYIIKYRIPNGITDLRGIKDYLIEQNNNNSSPEDLKIWRKVYKGGNIKDIDEECNTLLIINNTLLCKTTVVYNTTDLIILLINLFLNNKL